MTHGTTTPRCDRCPVHTGLPCCDRCGRVVAQPWVHAHDPPAWWHAACWAAVMRSLDPFTGDLT